MSRILCIGDPHFRVKNIADVNLYITNITALAQQLQPDFIVCLGDLLHEHEKIHTLILNKAYEFLRAMIAAAPTFCLVGNHDMINASQFLSQHHWMGGMKAWKGLTVVDKVERYKPLKTNPEETGALSTGEIFYFAPYVPPGRFVEALDTYRPQCLRYDQYDSLTGKCFTIPPEPAEQPLKPTESRPDWRSATAIFGHQEFRGCKMGAMVSEIGDAWPLDYPLCILGHIHDKQTPQPNVVYVGSSAQHGYGESGDKTVALFTFKRRETTPERKEKNDAKNDAKNEDKGEPNPGNGWDYTIEEYDLGLPKRTIKALTVLEAQSFLATFLAEISEYTKLKITGTYAEIKAFRDSKIYQEVLKKGAKMSFKHEERKVKSHSELTKDRLTGILKIKDFSGILADLVAVEQSSLLTALHQELLDHKKLKNSGAT